METTSANPYVLPIFATPKHKLKKPNGLSNYGRVSAVHAVLTMGAPGVPQLVGATCGVQLAPPVSFFSL